MKLNKDIEFFEKKLRGEKIDDSDDKKDFIDIFNLLNEKPKKKEIKVINKNGMNFPKIGSNKSLKKLVIRTNTSDYFKEEEEKPKKKKKANAQIVEEKMLANKKIGRKG